MNFHFLFVGMYGKCLHIKLTGGTLFFKYLAILLKHSQKEFDLLKTFLLHASDKFRIEWRVFALIQGKIG